VYNPSLHLFFIRQKAINHKITKHRGSLGIGIVAGLWVLALSRSPVRKNCSQVPAAEEGILRSLKGLRKTK
jgi:hypothetical protein